MSKELIRLRDLCMAFDDEPVLDHINLYINDKEFLTLLGPSGCGKTTTLRIIGGFATPTSGDVLFDGVRINDVPPYQRQINTVFQKYALFPHLNVYENIAFGLRMQKLPEAEIKERVMEMLETVSLKGFEHRRPEALSGGQQQRVAIARALVNRPKVLLLDEPLAALDLKLRKDMQIELKRIQQQVGITFIYVTHDQEEALTMSDTIVVMDKGSIQQIGTPEDIYNEPKNAFVADFIGESNIIDGIMPEDNVVQMYGRRFPCLDGGFAPNEAVDVVIRPEDIDIVPVEQGQLTGTVTSVTFKGMQYDIIVDFRGFKWLIQTTDLSPVGSRIGKHKMVPKISPKKSWEGFAGGILGSVLIWLILWATHFYKLSLPYALLCGVVVSILGVIGDLIESRIKRGVGVKDSGNLIPGHGGMLDRSDSLIFGCITAQLLLMIGGVL